MDQEKFVGKYIELLNSTVSEAIQKNIVSQAQLAVFDKELADTKAHYEYVLAEKEKVIDQQRIEMNTLRQKVGTMNETIVEADAVKQHVDTYVKELIASRQEIEHLQYLIAEKDKELAKFAPPPVVVNKLGKKNTPTTEAKVVKVKSIRDAGSF